MSQKLWKELIAAEKANDTDRIEELLIICDKIHAGIKCEGYEITDLPPDAVYEKFVRTYNHSGITNTVSTNSIMIMATIPKSDELVKIENVMLMPKYDGCSIAIMLKRDDGDMFVPVYANTRGKENGDNVFVSDVTFKILSLIKSAKFNVSTKLTDSIKQINARCELVLNYSERDEHGILTIPAASTVAGKLNGYLDVFVEARSIMCLRFYEISKIITTDDKELTPTQDTAIKLLKHLNIIYYDDHIEPANDSMIEVFKTTPPLKTFMKVYDEILNVENCPTDGIVYCSTNWKYPQDKALFKSVNYGKYAWKPDNFISSTLTNLEWSMGKTGELNPIVHFDEFVVGGKKYSKCKSSISQLEALQLGEGAICSIEIVHGINAHITEILKPAEKPFDIPKKCPYCHTKAFKNDKHLTCQNDKCIECKIQKFVFMIKSLHKLEPLTFLNDKGKKIKSPLSKAKLRKIADSEHDLNFGIISKWIPNLEENFNKLSDENKMYVMSCGGMTQIKKMKLEDVNTKWLYE